MKGILGLGLPTLAMGLLAVVMTPAEAAAILVLPSLVTNAWQLLFGPSLVSLARRLWPMLGGICIGTWAGAGQIAGVDAESATLALGGALAAYALVGLSGVNFAVPPGAEPWLSPIAGVLTGLVTAVTGVFVLPAVPYLQSLGLRRDELVQALAMSFTVSTIALAAGLAGVGAFGSATGWGVRHGRRAGTRWRGHRPARPGAPGPGRLPPLVLQGTSGLGPLDGGADHRLSGMPSAGT